ncbi:uncharacterized protein A1O5_11238 [Cladophialophora psammophila CBS 110553]|uniref:Uncharacterized protein n=1 Tax=Cladophialophora psammophila CBS 110553 TaxID=1182543 RepID=W9WL33_9EURO|nr:uncharacterized protein A1O5_11238 [Cladophialophora psammophila CBS 110553]EXJ65710.1 hypothetical protein A1O5_11238 [Cladophialophora psammophila CBS 110553]
MHSLGQQTTGIQRKYDEIQHDQEILNRLLDNLRESSDAQVAQIISLIRSNASMEEVKSCIEQELDRLSRSGREPTPEFVMLEIEIWRESQINRHR